MDNKVFIRLRGLPFPRRSRCAADVRHRSPRAVLNAAANYYTVLNCCQVRMNSLKSSESEQLVTLREVACVAAVAGKLTPLENVLPLKQERENPGLLCLERGVW